MGYPSSSKLLLFAPQQSPLQCDYEYFFTSCEKIFVISLQGSGSRAARSTMLARRSLISNLTEEHPLPYEVRVMMYARSSLQSHYLLGCRDCRVAPRRSTLAVHDRFFFAHALEARLGPL
jgi:hypothetical protein